MTDAEAVRIGVRLLGAFGVIAVLFLASVGAGALWQAYVRRREH